MWLADKFSAAVSPLRDLSERWAARRRPRGKIAELNQKRIFIFPTAAGWAYLAVCIILFLIAINYQNNLIHACAFLLIALGVLTIHYTFLNLSGLRITALRGFNCYVGDMAEFRLKLEADNRRSYESISLCWRGEPVETVFLESDSAREVGVFAKARQRGRFSPGSLKIETVFPLGLLRAWSWFEPELSAVVYPRALKGRLPQWQAASAGEGEMGRESQGEDFSGLEEYQPGVSTRHIAWKQYAQGRGLLSKQYRGQQSHQIWLDWEAWPELGQEQRLSVICYWAKALEHQGQCYGLSLPGLRIVPDMGAEHLEKILTALALFAQPRNPVAREIG